MITIEQLRVRYKATTALDIDTPIIIQPSDRIGIIGSNGAGKTTFIKACLGLIKYEGKIISDVKPEQMAVHMQFNHYIDTVNCKVILEAVLQTTYKTNSKLQELVQFFTFEENLKKKFKDLSGGQKQRFTLILVLMQDAPVTFFDEVTTGLDFETRSALIQKILQWYEHKESAILFVTHYYQELEQLTNKLMILHEGKVVAFDSHRKLFETYCGHSVITFDQNSRLNLENYRQIIAPQDTIAVACDSKEEELALTRYLIEQEMNFKRSNQDIELLTLNAIGGHPK
ncbi:ATP-binding cassette domain-containing protein [Candidatus Enterococcus willemsii]|uniref:ABC transporter ATP-binding protein n=1 Tax=Candidatus Enterococcus willemsii TaxID=1857215 RepID=A0ABQ6Z1B7_9ENTE|nr:ATP-binding cassette domain-containing protein [Enterococcus sp. CU12B]KAF1305087.1 ABC transporter ATP-binding protein [Enterococcus sp. CU12B]